MESSTSRRLECIDVLRALAALAVFVFHVAVYADFPKRTLPPFELLGRTFATIPSPRSLGATGVTVFFLISGFCLALQRLQAPRLAFSRGEARVFARNRFAHVVPAYWVSLLLAAPVAWMSRPGLPEFVDDFVSHALFLHGLRPQTFISLNGALWSMATEVELYLVFPLLLLLWERLGTRRFFWTTALFTLAFRFAVASLPGLEAVGEISWKATLSYQLPGRLSEFVLGMVLGKLYHQGTMPSSRAFGLAFLALLGPVLWIRGWGPYWLPDFAMGLLYFALLGLVLQLRFSWNGRAARLASAFGRSSYSFFLVHVPMLAVLTRISPFPQASYSKAAFLLATGLPIAVAAGVALHRGVEVPLGKRLRAKPARQPAAELRAEPG